MPTTPDPTGAIQAAFDKALDDLNLGFPIAWKNTDFAPVPGDPFLEPSMAARTQVVLTPGMFGPVEHLGSYQIAVYYPKGEGLQNLLSVTKTLANTFKIGAQFTVTLDGADDNRAIVTNVRQPPEVQMDRWIMQPFLVDWFLIQQ